MPNVNRTARIFSNVSRSEEGNYECVRGPCNDTGEIVQFYQVTVFCKLAAELAFLFFAIIKPIFSVLCDLQL